MNQNQLPALNLFTQFNSCFSNEGLFCVHGDNAIALRQVEPRVSAGVKSNVVDSIRQHICLLRADQPIGRHHTGPTTSIATRESGVRPDARLTSDTCAARSANAS